MRARSSPKKHLELESFGTPELARADEVID
jgi:hypothetical protein